MSHGQILFTDAEDAADLLRAPDGEVGQGQPSAVEHVGEAPHLALLLQQQRLKQSHSSQKTRWLTRPASLAWNADGGGRRGKVKGPPPGNSAPSPPPNIRRDLPQLTQTCHRPPREVTLYTPISTVSS